jgi:hypothetical protein
MDGDLPSAGRLERVVGGLIDEAAASFPNTTVRAFGEMVDVLWRRGQEQAAIALEELWDDLARRHSFALLCGYRLDIFDVQVQRDTLPELFRTHAHAQPVAEPARLAAAVDQALADVVGPVEAARIYLDLASNVAKGSVPRAQAVLGWLSMNDPPVAATILERARSHYDRFRSASAPTTA